MKSTRFLILAAMLTALIASEEVSETLKKKINPDFVRTYSGMNAASANLVAQKCASPTGGTYAKFVAGTGGYIAANIGLGGQHQELVTSDLKKKEGVTNLQYTLPVGEVLIFDRLVVEHATASSVTAVEEVTGWSKSLPAELLNGSIEIKTNGKVVFNGRLSVINDAQNNNEKAFYQLFDPRYLLDDKTWQVVIKMPKNFTSGDDHYVRVNMDGAITTIS